MTTISTMSSKTLGSTVEDRAGYSGSDLKPLCKEAAMMPIRELGLNIPSVKANQFASLSWGSSASVLDSKRLKRSFNDVASLRKRRYIMQVDCSVASKEFKLDFKADISSEVRA